MTRTTHPIRYPSPLLSPAHARARRSAPIRSSLSALLAAALLLAACTDQRNVSPAGTSGSPGPAQEAAAGAGVQGGQPAQAGAGASGAETDAGRSSGGAEPDPPIDEPPLDDPDESPVVGGDPPDEDPPDEDPPDEDPPDEDPPDEDPPDGDPPRQARDLPCDVEQLLRTRCQTCHSSPPVAGASIPLLTYADLIAPSAVAPSVTVAARSLQRMKDSLSPMPPAPASPATSAEIAKLWAWLDSGLPAGRCDDAPSPNPYDASPTCSSGGYWTAFDSGTPWMNPGLPCIKCHRQNPNFAPLFSVAGTVFPTAHEPDKCFGVPAAAGAQVIIIDANGQELAPINVVSGGNFGAILSGLAMPYRAKVVVGDTERIMLTPQTNGDCNVCHTQVGSQGARGRIIVP